MGLINHLYGIFKDFVEVCVGFISKLGTQSNGFNFIILKKNMKKKTFHLVSY